MLDQTNDSKFTPERQALILDLWLQPISIEEICSRLGISTVTAYKYAKRLHLPNRGSIRSIVYAAGAAKGHKRRTKRLLTAVRENKRVSIQFEPSEMLYICLAAERRRIAPQDLCLRIMQTVIKDNLADAVLDDAA